MSISEFIDLLTCIFTAIFGAGGLCAFIITVIKLNKKSKKFEVRCRLAAEMIKAGIVKIEPAAAKELLLKVLEDRFDEIDKKEVNKILKEGKKELTK